MSSTQRIGLQMQKVVTRRCHKSVHNFTQSYRIAIYFLLSLHAQTGALLCYCRQFLQWCWRYMNAVCDSLLLHIHVSLNSGHHGHTKIIQYGNVMESFHSRSKCLNHIQDLLYTYCSALPTATRIIYTVRTPLTDRLTVTASQYAYQAIAYKRRSCSKTR